MTRREIFFIVSLICLGIFLLIGACLWRQSISPIKAADNYQDSQRRQSEIVQTDNNASQTSKTTSAQTNSGGAKDKTTATTSPATSPKTNPPVQSTNPATATNSAPAPSSAAQATALINNVIIPQEYQVGEFVKLGGLEMIVTKSTTRHKIIDITLTGNDTTPKIILNEKNHIIYEVPADTSVNMDISEKVVVEKSPLFNTP
ncbi:hypothetical protein Psch_00149 [Pelotomaculum schinkii]|uniref:Uncharacterized protein n=1 Tax=Pelotomaculum schinkii TaxID=78350 RepID=A0A4Y7RE72_9FIRM|nr:MULTISPECIES: hypothetical protein [Pelotomaculum]TEB06617.1 hypothetical protein Psch_00149 [Pelotomaculum schinkii]TEB17588.1 hypothetical protein Psfp_00460 [Pelotomaculum sp. FP]